MGEWCGLGSIPNLQSLISNLSLIPPGGLLQHFQRGAAGGNGAACGQDGAVPERVAPADLHRVHAQGRGEFVHLAFRGEMGLGRAEAAERAAGTVVGVDRTRVHPGVGDLVGAQTHEGRVAQHLRARVRVGPGVAGHVHLRGDDLAVPGGAPTGFDDEGVPLVMADDGLLPAPDGFHWAARLPRSQGQHNLHRQILPTAERAADGRVAHYDLLLG